MAWEQSGLADRGYRLRIAGEYTADRYNAYREVQGIEWLGVLDSFGVAHELRQARALLLPSLRETFSILTVEALLCHCQVWLGYLPLLEEYRGHPLVKALDLTDPMVWTRALQDNIQRNDSNRSLPVNPDDLNEWNSKFGQFKGKEVGTQLLQTLENIIA